MTSFVLIVVLLLSVSERSSGFNLSMVVLDPIQIPSVLSQLSCSRRAAHQCETSVTQPPSFCFTAGTFSGLELARSCVSSASLRLMRHHASK